MQALRGAGTRNWSRPEPMKVLERYILRRILVQSSGAAAASLSIVWIVQALTKVDLVTADIRQLTSSVNGLSLQSINLQLIILWPLHFVILLTVAF